MITPAIGGEAVHIQLPALETPIARPRRLRTSAGLRRMVRETVLTPSDLVLPLFVTHETDTRTPIESMPGVSQWSVDRICEPVEEGVGQGVPAVLLFGLPASKDGVGSGADDPHGVVQQALRHIKSRFPDVVAIADLCLCEYTDHGHCGVLGEAAPGGIPLILNDQTLSRLADTAVSQARAGADVVAPSGMMDGMVAAIREGLDANGFEDVAIMSYSTKYASAFYGPFRDAADGAPQFGDRKTYQMDPANARESLRENLLDVEQGADMLMVKPALAYLDVIRQSREQFPELPLVAYNVSGEYAMVKAAADRGWVDERKAVLEILTGIKRAGADIIITYHAAAAARWLNEERAGVR